MIIGKNIKEKNKNSMYNWTVSESVEIFSTKIEAWNERCPRCKLFTWRF